MMARCRLQRRFGLRNSSLSCTLPARRSWHREDTGLGSACLLLFGLGQSHLQTKPRALISCWYLIQYGAASPETAGRSAGVETGPHKERRVESLLVGFLEPDHRLICIAQTYIDQGNFSSI